ncbi:P-loop containing nucleoside triphosphate hydrolase protein [Gigaspora rosea]|uniref:P-loop containing nucleoside triphosphate hydrolase protein n=1 Tax=Gigaspora rosea TaxID=44941 RepID=A0A397W7N7_9GLOM|nr:P-loop containing nucleoside triphosphate hydrolase protein [Gigaspora rosea]CAG8578596.1 4166_t:CDS:1 [Gigaspora rosea]
MYDRCVLGAVASAVGIGCIALIGVFYLLMGIGFSISFLFEVYRTQHKVTISNQKKDKKDVQSIILVGRTGAGKSTLANVLSNDDKFAEIPGSASGTKDIQISEVFEWNGKKYRVIDTVGIGDTAELSNEKKISLFWDLFEIIRYYNIKQVFFVYKDRFENHQVEALRKVNKLLKLCGSIFNYNHIVLVSTNFPMFEDDDSCDQDSKRLLGDSRNKNIVEIIRNCKLIHVDNPSLDSPYYKEAAILSRESSREKLLNYLDSIASIENIGTEKTLNSANIEEKDIYTCFS